MILTELKNYLREFKKLKKAYPGRFNTWQLIRFFPQWLICLDASRTPLSDRSPWITFAAIEFLDKYLMKNMKVFEYGSGGSTIFLAQRVEDVISVEHQPEWYYQVSEELKKCEIINWQGFLIEAEENKAVKGQDPSDPHSYLSSESSTASYENYVFAINQYPDEYFDLVLIDGRARPSCLFHSLSKLKRGGFIMLDNSDRDYYLEQTSIFLQEFKLIDFPGPCPYLHHFSRTSAWQKLK